jgi:hypothetical protein
MREISNQLELDILRKTFYSIFKTNDPFSEMFCDSVKDRLLICPVQGYHLQENQLRAISHAAYAVGDEKLYISEVEGEPDCFSHSGHWECTFPLKLNEYEQLPVYLENALYSPNGKWGLLISHEEHAVIGGTELFINTFKKEFTDWEDGLDNFKELWEYNQKHYNSNIDWLPKFLSHIQKL